jgi:EAL domain-containing protein (putative c-di-GMP-specific phosphodiesterase class I)
MKPIRLVKSMVDIAVKLGKKTIAEFIESPNTALKLKELGVNFGQGYAFGKPERHLIDNLQPPLAFLMSSAEKQAIEFAAAVDIDISQKS